MTWSDNFVMLSDGCGATGSATVTFKATDDCDLFSTTTATFTIKDDVAPLITSPADSKVVQCDPALNLVALDDWLTSNGGVCPRRNTRTF